MDKEKSKKKSTPAGKKPGAKSSAPVSVYAGINVLQGTPSPDPYPVAPGVAIPFKNNDATDYYIQLYVGNTTPIVDVLLPKASTGVLRLMADPRAALGTACTYALTPTSEVKGGITGGGPHTIVISDTVGKTANSAKAAVSGR
jgi:hypothetical protein